MNQCQVIIDHDQKIYIISPSVITQLPGYEATRNIEALLEVDSSDKSPTDHLFAVVEDYKNKLVGYRPANGINEIFYP
ncbi:hypothetical protein [Wohlfahrtiimonas chitiniclastica]|uniref:hypothetical protein n=1 Tax=Wohlfahrtiimonas chitiniclastica TaxID=400946 RepID=UPI001BCE8F4B|nr:hypothetical protein [Wohlfahrtiimonas chitiniclastica]MBS7837367.1 hypothetical protein [Wohlfahrtiimonas chitiniclastica]